MSIVAPFVLAALLSVILYPALSGDNVQFTGFALFMGASMAITAFPVLARILAEHKLMNTKLGTVAITCAAVDDVSGWCVLAYIVALVAPTGLRIRSGWWLPGRRYLRVC